MALPRQIVKTTEKIRRLEVQGAMNVAIAGLESLKFARTEKELGQAMGLLASSRPTEPLLRNGIKYVKFKAGGGDKISRAVSNYVQNIRDCREKIAEYGSRRIKNGSRILVHCHSATVERILKKARADGKRFEVFSTETRPRFQGRITAQNLVKAKISVTQIVDSAMRFFINDMDLALVGSDAVTSNGCVVNKIGTSMLSLAADEARTNFVVATELLKLDPATEYGEYEPIEERGAGEVWERPPRGVRIRNPAFDVTPPKYISYLITEAGVISASEAAHVAKELYPWLFE